MCQIKVMPVSMPVSYGTQDVDVLLLPPNARLRYVIDDRSKRALTLGDAKLHAGLLFAAWDQTQHNNSVK